jgi:hypothetical protein
VNLYTQSTLDSKLELVNRLEQSLLQRLTTTVQSEDALRKSLKNKVATLAQLVERLIRNQQVAGSSPAGGSNKINQLQPTSKSPRSDCAHFCAHFAHFATGLCPV